MPVSPLIMGLLGTAGVLATGVCLVLAALCRRHYSRPCPRPEGGTKHVPMEAVIAADDLIVDGSVTGVRTPATPDAAITAEAVRNGTSIEATDPDIIRNQYGEDSLLFILLLLIQRCRIGLGGPVLHSNIHADLNSQILTLKLFVIKRILQCSAN
jgi:hypothetical protein